MVIMLTSKANIIIVYKQHDMPTTVNTPILSAIKMFYTTQAGQIRSST
ncbi:hypothetical protein Xekk_02970 [Xenorhabdus sp. KK7.4]|nr:hypothetical protein Xekk_02970 [Xenorhabdus sp. KK7.4]